MLSTKIKTKVIDVELTDENNTQIIKTITPVMQLIDGGKGVSCDVVIRKINRVWAGTMYCVLVRLTTTSKTYYVVASNRRLSTAISSVSSDLHHRLSARYVADMASVLQIKQAVHQKYFVEMFVN
jgi:hypothetical protein